MTKSHPITPPPELIGQWIQEWVNAHGPDKEGIDYVVAQAAQWGAEQGLEVRQQEIRPGLFSPQQKTMFNNYCEARANREKALSNYRKAEVGRDQANALYIETQKTWLQADGMLESIEEDCLANGFDPFLYLANTTNQEDFDG